MIRLQNCSMHMKNLHVTTVTNSYLAKILNYKKKKKFEQRKKSKPSMSHFLRSSPLSKKIAYNCECSSPKCTSKNVKKSCDILVMEKSITYQFFFLRQLFSQMIGMFNFSVGGVKNHKGHTQTEYSFHERIFNFEDEPIFFKLIRSLI